MSDCSECSQSVTIAAQFPTLFLQDRTGETGSIPTPPRNQFHMTTVSKSGLLLETDTRLEKGVPPCLHERDV
jgi:hypothetical protein